MKSLKNTDYPTCPYCGFEDKEFKEDNWDDEWLKWSDSEVVTCRNEKCGRDYKIRWHVDIIFYNETMERHL